MVWMDKTLEPLRSLVRHQASKLNRILLDLKLDAVRLCCLGIKLVSSLHSVRVRPTPLPTSALSLNRLISHLTGGGAAALFIPRC